MEEKIFDLMTKFYSEFTDFKADVSEKLGGLVAEQQKQGEDIMHMSNSIIRLEAKVDSNSKALFDGYEQTFEKVLEIEKKVEALSVKVDKQEVEIKVIKGGRA
jgi:tRNA A-37 threonylcarbamoyl transferase component Bud32